MVSFDLPTVILGRGRSMIISPALANSPVVQSTETKLSRKYSAVTRGMGVISLPPRSSSQGCCETTCTVFPSSLLVYLSNILFASFQKAIAEQPHTQILPEPLNVVVPAVLVGLGQLFVVTSTWQLGITGTFLGDYFGILMDNRVEGFPFNVLTDPMYVGSTMSFVGASLWYESPAGLLISLYVYIVYVIALRFEGYVCLSFPLVAVLAETTPIGRSPT